jgi:hypothetical protein
MIDHDRAAPSIADKNIELATTTLRGDIRDQILREFKAIPKSWQTSTEDEQSRLINRARDIADDLVRQAIDLVAGKGLPSLPILVGKITVEKSACKGVFECHADDENLLRIRHLQGSRAMFVLASPDAFNGEQSDPQAEVIGDLSIPDPDAPRADEAQLAKVGQGKAA